MYGPANDTATTTTSKIRQNHFTISKVQRVSSKYKLLDMFNKDLTIEKLNDWKGDF